MTLEAKAFDAKPLDKDIIFTKDDENERTIITGENQTIHWKEANVTVYPNGIRGKSFEQLKNNREGSGMVPKGVDLYITEGYLRKE